MYFRCLFNSNMKESQECKVKFNYSKLNMDLVIDFIYSGILTITKDNVMEITEMSTYLQVIINLLLILINLFILDKIFQIVYIYV